MKFGGVASVGGSFKNLPIIKNNLPSSKSANNLPEQKQFITANSRSSIGGISKPMSKLDGNASSAGFQSALDYDPNPNPK